MVLLSLSLSSNPRLRCAAVRLLDVTPMSRPSVGNGCHRCTSLSLADAGWRHQRYLEGHHTAHRMCLGSAFWLRRISRGARAAHRISSRFRADGGRYPYGASLAGYGEWVWCKQATRTRTSLKRRATSGPEHDVPDFGHCSAQNTETSQAELPLADAVHELNARDRGRRMPELLEVNLDVCLVNTP